MKFSKFVPLAFLVVESAALNARCDQAIAGAIKGAVDCSKYVISSTTIFVTALPSTITSSTVLTSTVSSTLSVASTSSTIITVTVRNNQTQTAIATGYSTSTQTDTTTLWTTTTPTVTATSTITNTLSTVSYVTSYTPTASAVLAKRDITTAGSCYVIPAYASACTKFAEYVAGCSSAGVESGTLTISLTLPAVTTTVQASAISTVTYVVTTTAETDLIITQNQTAVSHITRTETITLPIIATAISTAYSTVTGDPATSYAYETVTVTGSTPSSTQIVTESIPNFKLAMIPVVSGDTLYMQLGTKDTSYQATTDITSATIFTIDTLKRLVTTTNPPIVASAYNARDYYYMEALPLTFLATYKANYTPLSFVVNSDLTLTCTYKTANSFTLYVNTAANLKSWFYSIAGYDNFPTYIAHLIPQ